MPAETPCADPAISFQSYSRSFEPSDWFQGGCPHARGRALQTATSGRRAKGRAIHAGRPTMRKRGGFKCAGRAEAFYQVLLRVFGLIAHTNRGAGIARCPFLDRS